MPHSALRPPVAVVAAARPARGDDARRWSPPARPAPPRPTCAQLGVYGEAATRSPVHERLHRDLQPRLERAGEPRGLSLQYRARQATGLRRRRQLVLRAPPRRVPTPTATFAVRRPAGAAALGRRHQRRTDQLQRRRHARHRRQGGARHRCRLARPVATDPGTPCAQRRPRASSTCTLRRQATSGPAAAATPTRPTPRRNGCTDTDDNASRLRHVSPAPRNAPHRRTRAVPTTPPDRHRDVARRGATDVAVGRQRDHHLLRAGRHRTRLVLRSPARRAAPTRPPSPKRPAAPVVPSTPTRTSRSATPARSP